MTTTARYDLRRVNRLLYDRKMEAMRLALKKIRIQNEYEGPENVGLHFRRMPAKTAAYLAVAIEEELGLKVELQEKEMVISGRNYSRLTIIDESKYVQHELRTCN